MQIDNLIIHTPLITILSTLKSELALGGINRFEKMFDSGDDVMVCCPYHKDGQERRPSAGIRKSDGMFHCLACGETHSLPEVISYCFGSTDPLSRVGYKWLVNRFVSVEVQERDAIKLDFGRNSCVDFHSAIRDNNSNDISDKRDSNIINADNVTYITEEELDKYRYTHPYMYERGLTDDIIDLFDIGYDVDTGSITFPIKDSTGNCLFIARRSVRNKRFDLPKGIDKPLYGLYETFTHTSGEKLGSFPIVYASEIYVCEGLFDCLRLWCNGKVAVAGFGCLFSDYQIKQLKELPTRHLILALDNDASGIEGADRIRKSVKNKLITSVIIPNNKKDIGELTDDEIQNLQEVF